MRWQRGPLESGDFGKNGVSNRQRLAIFCHFRHCMHFWRFLPKLPISLQSPFSPKLPVSKGLGRLSLLSEPSGDFCQNRQFRQNRHFCQNRQPPRGHFWHPIQIASGWRFFASFAIACISGHKWAMGPGTCHTFTGVKECKE